MVTNKWKYSPNHGFGWCLISREGIVLGIAHVGWWFPVLVPIGCRNLPPSSPQRIGVAAASPAGDVQVPLVRTAWYAGTISVCHYIIHVEKCSGWFTVPSGKHAKKTWKPYGFPWVSFCILFTCLVDSIPCMFRTYCMLYSQTLDHSLRTSVEPHSGTYWISQTCLKELTRYPHNWRWKKSFDLVACVETLAQPFFIPSQHGWHCQPSTSLIMQFPVLLGGFSYFIGVSHSLGQRSPMAQKKIIFLDAGWLSHQ